MTDCDEQSFWRQREHLHFITVCSCGVVIAQCRCPGPKTKHVIEKGCTACKAETPTAP